MSVRQPLWPLLSDFLNRSLMSALFNPLVIVTRWCTNDIEDTPFGEWWRVKCSTGSWSSSSSSTLCSSPLSIMVNRSGSTTSSVRHIMRLTPVTAPKGTRGRGFPSLALASLLATDSETDLLVASYLVTGSAFSAGSGRVKGQDLLSNKIDPSPVKSSRFSCFRALNDRVL